MCFKWVLVHESPLQNITPGSLREHEYKVLRKTLYILVITPLIFMNNCDAIRCGIESSLSFREDHYPVCRLYIRQDSEFATGYGYPKTAFKREPDTDKDIRNVFLSICRGFRPFWKKLHIAQSFIYYIQKHLFSLLCHDSESVYGVISVS